MVKMLKVMRQLLEIQILVLLTNTTSTPNENGAGYFYYRTGANAGGKSGQTIVDITGINSGARKEFTLTVSASGAAA